MEHKARHEEFEDSSLEPCPMCGSTNVDVRSQVERFVYGDGSEAVELKAIVPAHRCFDCGFNFSAEAAETARHAAVCRHLGLMSPEEIVQIRSRYGLSRAELARITGIGDASLSRWENGVIIQNLANDNLLYLMSWPDNLMRLQTKGVRQREVSNRPSGDPHRWQLLDTKELFLEAQKSAEAFELQPA